MTLRKSTRINSPGVLIEDTCLLHGATAKDWDQALTGNMDKTLADVKTRVLAGGKKRNVSEAVSFDVASTTKKYFQR